MSPERLLEHFDRLAEVPGAVPRLRRFILDLAVRSRLVPQDSNDESARVFLGRRDISETVATRPWAIPSSWSWSSLRNLGHLLGGGTPNKGNPDFWLGPIPWVSPKDMKRDVITDAEDHISERALQESAAQLIPQGALLIVVRGMILVHSFPTAVTAVPVAINQDMKALVPFRADLLPYLAVLAKSVTPLVLRLVSRSTHGTCKLMTDDLLDLPVPIPPLGEQVRIKARVDELMALCDQLEAAQAEREQRRDSVVAASLNRVNDVADQLSRRNHAQFHITHLERFASCVSDVATLRQQILYLAVHGRLVTQNPAEEPVVARLARLNKARKGPPVITLSETDSPFEVPPSWAWTTVEACFAVSGGLQKTPQRLPVRNHYPYVGVGNVYRGRLDLSYIQQFELSGAELERYRLQQGDILVVEGNGSESEVGRCAIWNGEIPDCVHQNHIIRCRPLDSAVTPYVARYLNSPDGTSVMKNLAVTTSGLYNLSVGKIRKIALPLPPLGEQQRIVAKVDELMAICDRLEAQIAAGNNASSRLLDALLHEALSGTVTAA